MKKNRVLSVRLTEVVRAIFCLTKPQFVALPLGDIPDFGGNTWNRTKNKCKLVTVMVSLTLNTHIRYLIDIQKANYFLKN